jgi:hypothetical protein
VKEAILMQGKTSAGCTHFLVSAEVKILHAVETYSRLVLTKMK